MNSTGWNTDGWQQMLDEMEYRESYKATFHEQFDEVFQSHYCDSRPIDEKQQKLTGGKDE